MISTTCQQMEMSLLQISDVRFAELLMIRLIDANRGSLWHRLKPRDWWHESRLILNLSSEAIIHEFTYLSVM